jgi:hypothetical protein
MALKTTTRRVAFLGALAIVFGFFGILAADAAPVPQAGDALTADLAAHYQVPEHSVIWVRDQGISDKDLPVVLQVASEAQVPLRAVVGLRLQGWSWRDIRAHFGLAPPPLPVHVVVVAPLEAPLILPPPLLLRILLFPFFIFSHWR